MVYAAALGKVCVGVMFAVPKEMSMHLFCVASKTILLKVEKQSFNSFSFIRVTRLCMLEARKAKAERSSYQCV